MCGGERKRERQRQRQRQREIFGRGSESAHATTPRVLGATQALSKAGCTFYVGRAPLRLLLTSGDTHANYVLLLAKFSRLILRQLPIPPRRASGCVDQCMLLCHSTRCRVQALRVGNALRGAVSGIIASRPLVLLRGYALLCA